MLSNDPGMVYLVTGNEARLSPRRTEDVEELVRAGDWLVWFTQVRRPYLYDVPELAEMFRLEEVVFLGDGGVLRFSGERQ